MEPEPGRRSTFPQSSESSSTIASFTPPTELDLERKVSNIVSREDNDVDAKAVTSGSSQPYLVHPNDPAILSYRHTSSETRGFTRSDLAELVDPVILSYSPMNFTSAKNITHVPDLEQKVRDMLCREEVDIDSESDAVGCTKPGLPYPDDPAILCYNRTSFISPETTNPVVDFEQKVRDMLRRSEVDVDVDAGAASFTTPDSIHHRDAAIESSSPRCSAVVTTAISNGSIVERNSHNDVNGSGSTAPDNDSTHATNELNLSHKIAAIRSHIDIDCSTHQSFSSHELQNLHHAFKRRVPHSSKSNAAHSSQ